MRARPRPRRLDESLAEISLAHELDPLSLIISRDVGKQFYFARQYNEAIKELNRTIDLDPDFFLAHWYLGRTLVQQELYDEAITTFETAVALSEDDPIQIAALAHAQALSGNTEEALTLLEGLRQASDRRYVSPYAMAEIYIGLRERDSAFAWLQRAYEERSVYLIYLKLEPRFDGLRSDPRFEDLVRQMNFPR